MNIRFTYTNKVIKKTVALAAKVVWLLLFILFISDKAYSQTEVGDFVWNDLNRNGIQDPGEPGISGARVTITYPNGTTTATTTTNSQGLYAFYNLAPGKYVFAFTTPPGFSPVPADRGNDPTRDSDPVNGKVTVTVYANEKNPCIDAGFCGPANNYVVGDFVWKDLNCNGLQDTGEPGIANAKVTVKYPNGVTTSVTYTDANGKYGFENLPAGNYVFTFETPVGYTPSPSNVNNNNSPLIDSDPVNGSVNVTVYANEHNPTIDAGFCNAPTSKHSLGNLVWNDINGNGLKDSNEPGVAGVSVHLYKDDNNNNVPDNGAIATTTTSATGVYNFSNLPDGNYILGIETMAGYGIGGTAATSSDPDNNVDNDNNGILNAGGEYRSNAITLTTGFEPTNGNDNYTLDFALRGTACVGDLVWSDLNCNGLQDAGEPGIANVEVSMTFSDGTVYTVLTNSSGYYNFNNLGPGNVTVRFTTPSGYTASPADRGSDPTRDSDPINGAVMVTVYAGECNPCIDAGFCGAVANSSIGDLVWQDLNRNGIQDAGEPGFPGVTVRLTKPDGTIVTTVTNAAGFYQFTNLPTGTYTVCFVTPIPSAYLPSPANQGTDDTKDSDPVNGCVTIVLASGETNNTIDAGFYDDIDDDDDGIIDIVEGRGYDALKDCDGDGIPNYRDQTPGCPVPSGTDVYGQPFVPIVWTDCPRPGLPNGDGINNFFDYDNDGIIDELDLDSDNDGIPDAWETRDSKLVDANRDGMIDGGDSDGDGLLNSADGTPAAYGGPGLTPEDLDRDGIPNYLDLDSDGDGLTDLTEAREAWDSDGLADGVDSDGDGVNDSYDLIPGRGARGVDLKDRDNDGKPNPYDVDSDNDGITDNVEGQPTCSYKQPAGNDVDKDGVDDAYDLDLNDCPRKSGGITPYDKDGDTTPDIYDLDTDNDGSPDVNEGSGIYGNFVTQLGDADSDGLIDQFDIFNIKTATGNYTMNVVHSNMGPNGSFDGPVPGGSNAKLPKSKPGGCPEGTDRDWRDISILAVTLVEFKGNMNNGKVALSWTAANEANMSHYIVERSVNGGAYTEVTKVLAKGNNTAGNFNYILNDDVRGLASTTVYYRLKQVEKTNAEKFSSVISFKLANNAESVLGVYPNPATSYFTLKVNIAKDGMAAIIISDLAGRRVLTQMSHLSTGTNALTFNNLSTFTSGTYNVQLVVNGQVLNQKLIVTK
jgi:hypothetical protein